MRTVMLVVKRSIYKSSTCLHVSIYRRYKEIWFHGFINETICRLAKDRYSVGIWKIKKLK